MLEELRCHQYTLDIVIALNYRGVAMNTLLVALGNKQKKPLDPQIFQSVKVRLRNIQLWGTTGSRKAGMKLRVDRKRRSETTKRGPPKVPKGAVKL